MINFFRTIKKGFIHENKFSKYLLYAFGEIVLVVIGILIALQINNSNDQKTERKKELKYLANIKIDLSKDLESLDYNIDFRSKKSRGTEIIINQMNGAPIKDLTETAYHVLNTLYMERFQPSNVTYRDLVSSGNMNIISRDSIKILLFELSLLYQSNDFYMEYETNEYEEFMAKSIYKKTDVYKLKPIYLGEATAEQVNLKASDFDELFRCKEYKNGCVISNWTTKDFILLFKNIKEKSGRVITFINEEIGNHEDT